MYKNGLFVLLAERHSRILQKLGLSPSCLSHSGNISLKTLVDVSSLLDVRRPSDSELVQYNFSEMFDLAESCNTLPYFPLHYLTLLCFTLSYLCSA